MRGTEAFDELVQEGFMTVNPQTGWGRISRLPKSQRELDWLVSLIKTLGSWSVIAGATIEVSTGDGPHSLLFRKLKD